MTTPTPNEPQGADDQAIADPAEDQTANPESDVDTMDPYAVTIPPPEDDSQETAEATTDDPPTPEATADAPEAKTGTPGAAPADPVAEAQAVIAAYEQSQAQECARELEAVLTKYGLRLEVSPAQITLVPADKG